jgi:hypothetical protein
MSERSTERESVAGAATVFSPSTSSVAGSPARTSAAPAARLDSTESSPVFGSRWLDSFASFDRDTSSWRTSQTCLLGGLEPFSAIWPRAGMTRSGIAFRLRPLAPRMAVTVSGSSLIPTPTKGDAKSAANATARRRKVPPTGVHSGLTLTDFVRMYPTPQARQKQSSRGGGRGKGSISRGGGLMLDNVLGGKPNPTFVEWLMGYPPGWTMLDSPPLATGSSRSLRSGSAIKSSPRKQADPKDSEDANARL